MNIHRSTVLSISIIVIGGSEALFDAKGDLTKESTRGYLIKFMEAFLNWVRKH